MSLPSLLILLLTIVQPLAIDNLEHLKHIPYLGGLVWLVEFREGLVDCCSQWLYLNV